MNEELKELLIQNLSLDLDYGWDIEGKYLTISINYDGETICNESVIIERD